MRFPRGATFSVDRKFVFVADAGNHRVLVLRGDTGRRVWAWGSPGTGSIQFSYPWGVACWKSRIWVRYSGAPPSVRDSLRTGSHVHVGRISLCIRLFIFPCVCMYSHRCERGYDFYILMLYFSFQLLLRS